MAGCRELALRVFCHLIRCMRAREWTDTLVKHTGPHHHHHHHHLHLRSHFGSRAISARTGIATVRLRDQSGCFALINMAMVSHGVCVVVVGCGAVSAPFIYHFFVSCPPPMWFIVCFVSSHPSAGPCLGDVSEACYDGAMSKFDGWVHGNSAFVAGCGGPVRLSCGF